MPSMNIALTYNVKPDLPLSAPTSTAFPSLDSVSVSDQISAQLEATVNTEELFAEWDAPETIEAVSSALEHVGDVYMIEADE